MYRDRDRNRSRSRSRSPPRGGDSSYRHGGRDDRDRINPVSRDARGRDGDRPRRLYEDKDSMPDMRPAHVGHGDLGRTNPYSVDQGGIRMLSSTLQSSSVRGRAEAPPSAAALAAGALLEAAVSSAARMQPPGRVNDDRFRDEDGDGELGGASPAAATSRTRAVDAFGRELRPGAAVDFDDASHIAARARARERADMEGAVVGDCRTRTVTDALPSDKGRAGEVPAARLSSTAVSTAAVRRADALLVPVGVTEEEAMARLLGFSDFASTHGKAVRDNSTGPSKGACTKVLKREYRQYMNRKGGFNRPLAESKPISRGGGGGAGGGK